MAELTDEQIALRVQEGQTFWFAFIVDRYEARLLRYAKKFLLEEADAEDLVQEVFTKAYVSLRSFDASRRFSPWIYRIAHNEFVSFAKKRRSISLSFVDMDTIFPGHVPDEEPPRDEELAQALDTSLTLIDEKYREVLVLYYYESMGYKEISDVLAIPVPTVGVRLKRGREMLKRIIEQEQGNAGDQ
jgi:RNA polymerase sigma-70 factor (ECF subfamily)